MYFNIQNSPSLKEALIFHLLCLVCLDFVYNVSATVRFGEVIIVSVSVLS